MSYKAIRWKKDNVYIFMIDPQRTMTYLGSF